MLTIQEVREICRKLSPQDDEMQEDVSCVVYRQEVFDCGDMAITERHIDIEYCYGEYYEVQEDTSLFPSIAALYGLPLPQKGEAVLYQKEPDRP